MDADKFLAGLRVLAVDDDHVCLKILERQLRHCKYDVTTATHAETALEMLRARKDGDQFDLVISDVHMPDMDGFKLLELVGLEMDIPVIMLSANEEMETMMKGIKHGACDYLVKPVHLDRLRNIWLHVVKKSKNDPRYHKSSCDNDAGHEYQSRDDNNEMDCANDTKKNSRKNKKDGDAPDDEDSENTSSSNQKRQRIQWSGQLHRKFVEVVNQIGIDRAVPKKILEMMNVDGISREHVASHLQKYRLGLKRLSLGEHRQSNPFSDEPVTWRRNWNYVNMNGLDNSSSVFGTHSLLHSQSVQPMTSHRNLSIPLMGLGPAGDCGNLLVKDSVRNVSKFTSSCNSYGNTLNGGQSGASTFFPSGYSGSSSAGIPNYMVLNTSNPFPSGTSGNSFANIWNESLATVSISFPSSHSGASNANKLHGRIFGKGRDFPFGFNNSIGNIGNGKMAPQYSGLSNSSNSWKTTVPSKFPDLGHKDGASRGPSQGNSLKINQLSGVAASSGQMKTSGNEFQNQMTALMSTSAPVVGFCEQMAPLNLESNTNYTVTPINCSALGSASSIKSALPSIQVDNLDMQTQMLNGEGGSGNLLKEDRIVDQQAVGDHLGTSDAQNQMSGDLDDFLSDWLDRDSQNGDASMDGNWESHP